MLQVAPSGTPSVLRRVFPSWSIAIPTSFAETFVAEGEYWHAYDEHDSVSLTSMLVDDKRRRPVPAKALARKLPPLKGSPVTEFPAGLSGKAITGDAIQPARASRMLSGMLVLDGKVLIVTITTDDPDLMMRTWLSIRHHRIGFPERR